MRSKNLCSIRDHLRSKSDARLPLRESNQSHQIPLGSAPSGLISIDGIFWFKPVYGVPKQSNNPLGTIRSEPFVPEE